MEKCWRVNSEKAFIKWGFFIVLGNEFALALAGREYWMSLKESYGINEDCYLVLCPSEDSLLNKMAMKNLSDFLIRKYIKRAVVLSIDSAIKTYFPCTNNIDVFFEIAKKEKMDSILKYYRLTQFAFNVVVISMEMPFGNSNIIGKKGITLEDYIKDAIYV